MKTPKTSLNHGIAAAQGRTMGPRAVGGLAAVISATGTVLRVAELDFTGSAIEEIADGVVQISGEAQVGHYRNNSGSDFELGDVVVLDSSGDKSVTFTTTPRDPRPAGVVLQAFPNGEIGLVAWSGDVSFVKVVLPVTRGFFAETSSVAGKATENDEQRTGSFGQFLTGGASPSIRLFGSSAAVGGADTPVDHGNMGAAETIDAGDGTWHRGVLDADCTITVSGFTVDQGLVVLVGITQDSTGGWAITWDPDVVFAGDDQPGLDPDAVTWYALWSDEGDSIVYGARVGGGTSVEALDDLADVNAPAPADQDALIWDAATSKWIAQALPATGVELKDEGGSLGVATSIDFVGPGVTATGGGAAKTVTIPGGAETDHAHVADERHLSDGAATTYTLDQFYVSGSVMAVNATTGVWLSVVETEPDQVAVSAAGASGDAIAFSYAAAAA